MPSLSSTLPTVIPGVLRSTMKQHMPLLPIFLSRVARTVYIPAVPPLLINCLEPFKIYSSPDFTQRVEMPPASEPAPGSVKQKAPSSPSTMRPNHSFFCSSLAATCMGSVANSELATMMVPIPASPQQISSATIF